MFKFMLFLALVLVVTCFELQFASLASIFSAKTPNPENIILLINESVVSPQQTPQQVTTALPDTTNRSSPTITSPTSNSPPLQVTAIATVATTTSETKTTFNPKVTTYSDEDTSPVSSDVPDGTNETTTIPTAVPLPLPPILPPHLPPDLPQSDKPNTRKPPTTFSGRDNNSTAELGILFYSIFIVYVSVVKLIYHNIHLINHNLTEQGILMIFGILWQLVARKLLTTDHSVFPRFNSRIFFYLFLPSTVLESASLLSNKWLFFNLLPILTHSIIGTVLYTSAMGFTIFSLAHSNVFTQNWIGSSTGQPNNAAGDGVGFIKLELSELVLQQSGGTSQEITLNTFVDPSGTTSGNSEQNDLSLAECLIFGTILSSIDSAPMLTVFKQYQVNEKLYYLVLGENLMNNAVVITIFNSLIDLFETTKLTVFRIYLATLQFFANLVGAVFIGFALALFALISVRLTKRCQLPNVLLSYQNQCQAMVETLLILKLAYLTYTLSNMAGTSSIVGLATFGILNDQYIKHNLNLRSQLAFRQVILGMKTMGYSLVYPLLGMLLVDTALHQHGVLDSNGSSSSSSSPSASSSSSSTSSSMNHVGQDLVGPRSKQARLAAPMPRDFEMSLENEPNQNEAHVINPPSIIWNTSSSPPFQAEFVSVALQHTAAASVAAKKLTHLANQASLNWYVKFLSIVILLTLIYRFLIVISLGLIGNVLTCGQLKIKFKEQLLMAYGGFKGPLSMALVHNLMEHDNHREKNTRNKHLFKYTVLMNIFISAVLAGTFIRPLVARIQTTLIGRISTNLEDAANPTIVFDQVNYKLTEYVSHGLNSILGHSRSSYEKFIEFNETHIKPWLVRGGSNTNWLSVFYDNLILDETLNANCFHIATEDPTTMRAFRGTERHIKQRPMRGGGQHEKESANRDGKWKNMWRRHSSSVSFLDTIDETPPVARVAPDSSKLNEREPQWSGVSIISANSSRAKGGQVPKDQKVLKEFVMLDFKLDEAKRRRQTQKRRFTMTKSSSNQKHHDEMQPSPSIARPIRPKFMTDNSSSNLTDSSLDRASRHAHLDQLEFRLAESDRSHRATSAVADVPRDISRRMREATDEKMTSRYGSHSTFDLDLPAQYDDRPPVPNITLVEKPGYQKSVKTHYTQRATSHMKRAGSDSKL